MKKYLGLVLVMVLSLTALVSGIFLMTNISNLTPPEIEESGEDYDDLTDAAVQPARGWQCSNCGILYMTYPTGGKCTNCGGKVTPIGGFPELTYDYTITYYPNYSGVNVPAPYIQSISGTSITVSFPVRGSSTFSHPYGYVLSHWNTQPDGSGTDYQCDATARTKKNLTLYAQWRGPVASTINLDSNDGYIEVGFYIDVFDEQTLDWTLMHDMSSETSFSSLYPPNSGWNFIAFDSYSPNPGATLDIVIEEPSDGRNPGSGGVFEIQDVTAAGRNGEHVAVNCFFWVSPTFNTNLIVTINNPGGYDIIVSSMVSGSATPVSGEPAQFITFDGSLPPQSGTAFCIESDGHLDFLPEIPTRDGYTFQGFFEDPDSSNVQNQTGQYYDENCNAIRCIDSNTPDTLYAHWAPTQYTITYVSDSESSTDTYTQQGGVTLPSPDKVGYTFAGWKADGGGNWGTDIYQGGAVLSGKYGNVTLTAQWNINSYNLTVNPNGGTHYKNLISASPGEDYSITGVDQTTKYSYLTNTYTSTTNGTSADPLVLLGDRLTVPLSVGHTYVMAGYVSRAGFAIALGPNNGGFMGDNPTFWANEAGDFSYQFTVSTTATYNFDFENPANIENCEVVVRGLVIYDLNSATTDPITYSVPYGHYQQLVTPTKDHYTLNGWETSSASGNSTNSNFKTDGTSAGSVTAQWKPFDYTYTLLTSVYSASSTGAITNGKEFNLGNFGDSVSSIAFDADISSASATLVFGINYNEAGTGDINYVLYTFNITKGTTHYEASLGAGGFVRVNYWFLRTNDSATITVTNLNVYQSYVHTYNIEQSVTLPEKNKDGFKVTGWKANNVGNWGTSTYPVGTVPAGHYGNVTLTAQWSPITYTIDYQLMGGEKGSGPYENEDDFDNGFAFVAPVRTGYTFTGWSASGDFNGKTAQYRFVGYGDAPYSSWNGTPLLLNPNPSGTWYYCRNFCTKDGGKVVLTAHWEPITYTITYLPGDWTMPETYKTQYTIEESFELPTPTRKGYEFSEWNAVETDGNWSGSYFNVKEGMYGNVTLQPRGFDVEAPVIERTTYVQHEDGQGVDVYAYATDNSGYIVGVAGALCPQGYDYLSPEFDAPYLLCVSADTGDYFIDGLSYNFKATFDFEKILEPGMFAQGPFSATIAASDGSSYTNFGSAFVDSIYIHHTVTLDAALGSVPPSTGWTGNGASATKVVNHGAAYGLPTPTRDGYTFAGWQGNLFNKNMLPYASGAYIDGTNGNSVVNTSYSIYKLFIRPNLTYTIINSGESDVQGYAIYNQSGEKLAYASYGNNAALSVTAPSEAYYILVSVVANSTTHQDLDTFELRFVTTDPNTIMTHTMDHTLTAQWTPLSYDLTYDWNISAMPRTDMKNYSEVGGYDDTGIKLNWDTSFMLASQIHTPETFALRTIFSDRIDSNTASFGLEINSSGMIRLLLLYPGRSGWTMHDTSVILQPDTDYYVIFTWDTTINQLSIKAGDNEWTASVEMSGESLSTIKLGDIDYNYGVTASLPQYIFTTSDHPFTTKVTMGSNYPEFPELYSNAYNFGAWYTTPNATSGTSVSTSTTYTTASNSTVWAAWTGKQTTITLNSNGGTDGTTTSVTATYASAMPQIAPDNLPKRTGYTFAGYFDTSDPSGGTQYYASNGTSTHIWDKTGVKATLYARWTALQTNVTLNNNGGEGGTENVTATFDQPMPPAQMPTRAGYDFAGYYDSREGGTQYYSAQGTSANNWNKTELSYTLYARWEAITYTITLDPNGATEMGTTLVKVTYDSSTITPKIQNPSRTGYKFDGWGTTESEATMVISTAGALVPSIEGYTDESGNWILADGCTLFAQWTPISYTIEYQLMGGEKGSGPYENEDDFDNGFAFVAPVRTGYTFTGWSASGDFNGKTAQYRFVGYGDAPYSSWNGTPLLLNPNPSGTWYYCRNFCTKDGGKVVLTANWQANTYDVTLNANGGKWASDSSTTRMVTATYDQPMPVVYKLLDETWAKPVRDGYTFAGFFDSPDEQSGNMYYKADGSSNMPWDKDSTAVLYAHWTAESYLITYNENNGSMPVTDYTINYTIKDDITLPTPLRTGYEFTGWKANGVGNWDDSTYPAGKVDAGKFGNVTLTAQWDPIVYTITYLGNEGLVSQSEQQYNITQSVTLLTPTRVGYNFEGWLPSDGEHNWGSVIITEMSVGTGKYGDVTLTAQWKAKTFSIALKLNDGTETVVETISNVVFDQPMPGTHTTSRTAYDFLGYFDEKQGGNQYYDAEGASASVWNKDGTQGQTFTLYAQWNPTQYSIIYNVNGGSALSGDYTTNYTIESRITLPSTTQSGYNFGGWMANGQGNWDNTIYQSGDLGTGKYGDVTLKAVWTAVEYTFTLDANGGSITGETKITVLYNGELPQLEQNQIASLKGYTFTGYFDGDTAGTMYYDETGKGVRVWDKANNESILYAHWKPITYLVTLNQKGGHGGTESVEATFGLDMPEAVMPTRTGYTFQGYFDVDSVSGGNQYYLSNGVSAKPWDKDVQTELYARWSANDYTINYDLQGGEHGASYPNAAKFDASFNLDNPSRIGYDFMGWTSDDLNTDTAMYGDGPSSCTMPWTNGNNLVNNTYFLNLVESGSVNLKANWQAHNYTIKFAANGGDGDMANQNATFGEALKLNANKFELAGYEFVGWKVTSGLNESTAKFGANEQPENQVTDDTIIKDENYVLSLTSAKDGVVILTAQWTEASYTVKLDANEGVIGSKTEVLATYTKEMPEIANNELPTRDGYAFTGFFDQTEGGKKYYNADGTSANVWDKTSGATLYAQWESNGYTITLQQNGGQDGDTSIVAKFDMPMPSVITPTRTGYDFIGYFDVDGDDGGNQYYTSSGESARNWDKAHEATLYARWAPIIYTIVLNFAHDDQSEIIDNCQFDSSLEIQHPQRTGYAFAGWNLSDGDVNTAMTSADNDIFTSWQDGTQDLWFKNLRSTAGSVMLTAVWTPNTYEVELRTNGGHWSDGTDSNRKVLATFDQNLPMQFLEPADTAWEMPTREGWEFLGFTFDYPGSGRWAYSATGEGLLYDNTYSGAWAYWREKTWDEYTESYDGLGTSENPYIIDSEEKFAMMAYNSRQTTLAGAYFRLDKDLDMNAHLWSGIGTSKILFSGHFDGNWHTIKNIRLDNDVEIKGVFTSLGRGSIKNLYLKESELHFGSQGQYVAGLVGSVYGGTITNVQLENITIFCGENLAGGLVGLLDSGEVNGCAVRNLTINGQNVAGLVYEAKGTLQNSFGIDITINSDNGEVVFVKGAAKACFASGTINGVQLKVMYGGEDDWSNWTQEDDINDGYPMPHPLYHQGQIGDSNKVYRWLTSNEFEER